MAEVTLFAQRSGATAAQPAVPAVPAAPSAPTSPDVVTGETPAPGVITIQRGGKTITIDGATGGGDLGGVIAGTGFPQGFPRDIPSNVYNLAKDGIIGFSLMIIAFPVFGFLKALVNRSAAKQTALPSRDTTDRLQRIEAAVEAMSVEVERISEGQRFVTKVLSERSSAQT